MKYKEGTYVLAELLNKGETLVEITEVYSVWYEVKTNSGSFHSIAHTDVIKKATEKEYPELFL